MNFGVEKTNLMAMRAFLFCLSFAWILFCATPLHELPPDTSGSIAARFAISQVDMLEVAMLPEAQDGHAVPRLRTRGGINPAIGIFWHALLVVPAALLLVIWLSSWIIDPMDKTKRTSIIALSMGGHAPPLTA